MDLVHESGPWTRSTEGVHGPGVHVLYFPGIRSHNRGPVRPVGDGDRKRAPFLVLGLAP